MKIFKYLSMLLLITLAIAACKDHEYDVYGGGSDNFRFPSNNRSASISEGATSPAAIPIIFSKLVPKAGTVSVSFSGAVQNTDFVASATEFTFSENQYHDTLYIQPIPNDVENENLVLVISLNSSELIGWAGDSTSQDYTLTITDDDATGCPFIDLAGTYSCLSNGTSGGANPVALDNFPGSVTFTAIGDPNEAPNQFSLSDPSFSLYPDGYDIAIPGVGTVTEDCGNLTLAPFTDQYDDPWTFSGTADASQNMTIIWSNTYGDAATVTLSPL